MVRPFVLALTLAVSAVACANGTRDVQSPEAALVPPPPAPLMTPAPASDAPPVLPPQLMTTEAAPAFEARPAPSSDDAVDPAMLAVKAEAEVEATAEAKNKAKWEKLGAEADRRATDTYARERLGKLSARGAQAQNQSSRVPPARRAKYNNDVTSFATKKDDVQLRIGSLSATGSDEWKRVKAELDHALDELDMATNKLEGNLY